MAETYVIKKERKSGQHSEGVRDVGNELPWDNITWALLTPIRTLHYTLSESGSH